MTKLIDTDNDNATQPETAYQGEEKPVSRKGTSLSFWGLVIAVVFIAALAIFAFSRSGSHTDPAPNGGMGNSGATAQPPPTQNN